MITQSFLDFLRDIVVNWLSGVASIFAGVDVASAGAAIGGVADASARVLWILFTPGGFAACVAVWSVFLAVWLVTSLIAIIGRRGAS